MADPVETDFEDLKTFLMKIRIISSKWLKQNSSRFKVFHKLTFPFLIWDHCLTHKEPYRRYFVREARSDSIHAVLTVLIGCRKSASLLLRGLIEDILRHIYYFDHPVEFNLLSKYKEYVPFRDLITYVKKHPKLSRLLEKTDCLARLQQVYETTSKYVHAKSEKFMQLSKALDEIKFDQTYFDWHIEQLKLVASDLNLLLVIHEFEEFRVVKGEYRKAILETMSRANKKLLSEI